MSEVLEEYQCQMKALRESKGMTLEAVADRIGSSKSYVWELENKPGIRLGLAKAYDIALALDTTLYFLMGEPEPAEISTFDATFIRDYLALPANRKMDLAAIALTFAERVDLEEKQFDLGTCPGCGGPADNGHDRCEPPSPYYCTKCSQ